LPPVALAWGLAARPRSITPCSPPAGGTPRRPLGGDYGQPECENDGRIRGYQRIRRGQAGQGPETACAGRYTRAAPLGGGHPSAYLRPGRGATPAHRAPAAATAPGACL